MFLQRTRLVPGRQVLSGIHPVVEETSEFDDAVIRDTIEEEMASTLIPATDVEGSRLRVDLRPTSRARVIGVRSDPFDRGADQVAVSVVLPFPELAQRQGQGVLDVAADGGQDADGVAHPRALARTVESMSAKKSSSLSVVRAMYSPRSSAEKPSRASRRRFSSFNSSSRWCCSSRRKPARTTSLAFWYRPVFTLSRMNVA